MSFENCTQGDAVVVESVGCAGQCRDDGGETFALGVLPILIHGSIRLGHRAHSIDTST